jgi:acyl carrier protein
MEQAEIQTEVAAIIKDILDMPSLVIDRETSANQVEGWDSLNHINIVVAVEMRFGIKFKTAEIELLRNVGEFVDLIAQKLRAKR